MIKLHYIGGYRYKTNTTMWDHSTLSKPINRTANRVTETITQQTGRSTDTGHESSNQRINIFQIASSFLCRSEFGKPLLMALDISLRNTPLNLGYCFFKVTHGDRIIWNLVLGHVLNLISCLPCYFPSHAI